MRGDAGNPPACKAGSLATTFSLNTSLEFIGISNNSTSARLSPVVLLARGGTNVTYALANLSASRTIAATEDVTDIYSRLAVRNAVNHLNGNDLATTLVDLFEVNLKIFVFLFSFFFFSKTNKF